MSTVIGTKSDDESISIPLKVYQELLEDQIMLRHLEANGVDNWSGYSRPRTGEDDEE